MHSQPQIVILINAAQLIRLAEIATPNTEKVVHLSSHCKNRLGPDSLCELQLFFFSIEAVVPHILCVDVTSLEPLDFFLTSDSNSLSSPGVKETSVTFWATMVHLPFT